MLDHGPFLRRLAAMLVSNPADAEDLVQDVWVAAASVDEGRIRNPQAWLAKVLRRGAAAKMRRASAQPVYSEMDDSALRTASQEEVAMRLERQSVLQTALARLEEPHRTAIYLRFHEGLMPKAIAERMDAPVKTVNSWLLRGLEKLRDQLSLAYGGGEEGRIGWFSAMSMLAVTTKKPSAAVHSVGGASVLMRGLTAAALAVGAIIAGGWLVNLSGSGSGQANGSALELSSAVPNLPATAEHASSSGAETLANARSVAPRAMLAAVGSGVAAASSTHVEIEVHVTSTDGGAAENVDMLLVVIGWAGVPGGVQVESTDAEGVARFFVEPGQPCRVGDLVGSNWKNLFEEMRAPSAVAGSTIEVELGLRETTPVRGRVVTADGTPQPGATIFATALDNSPPIWLPIGEADAAGAYSIECGSNMAFEAVVSGRLPSEALTVDSVPSNASGAREVDLIVGATGASFSGVVNDSSGEPVERAAIYVGPLGRSSGSLEYTRKPSPVICFTDADGHFEYPAALAQGEQPVAAFAQGFAVRSFVLEFGGEPVERTIRLDEGATVQGRVLNPDGSPAVKASVWVSPSEARWRTGVYGPSHGTYTDENGHFELRRVGQTDVEVRAESEYTTSLARGSSPWSISDTGSLEVALEEGRVIAGRVLDESGQPASGLVVRGKSQGMVQSARAARTDSEGRFRLTCLPRASFLRADQIAKWTVEVRSGGTSLGGILAARDGVVIGTEDLEIAVTTQAPAEAFIEGRIVSPDGPIPGNATLFFSHQTGRRITEEINRGIDFDKDTGAFRVGPLGVGVYGFNLWVPEQGEMGSINGVEVTESGVIDAGALNIGGGGTVSFTLSVELPEIFPDGILAKLMDDQNLGLFGQHREYELERSESGWHLGHNIPSGNYEMRRKSGEILCIVPTPVTIEEGVATEIEIEAQAGRKILLRALMDTSTEWSSAQLRCYDAAGTLVQVSRTRRRADLDQEDALKFLESFPLGPARIQLWIDGSSTTYEVTVTVLTWTESMDPVTLDGRG